MDNQSEQSEENKVQSSSRFFKKPKLFLTILVIVLVVISSLGNYMMITKKDKNVYSNDYWGFSVKYQKDWYMYDAPSGQNYFFQSFKEDPNSNFNYIPKKDQLKIKISVNDDYSISWQNYAGYIKTQEGPIIGGEKSQEVYIKNTSKNNINEYIVYEINHYGKIYRIFAEPANSTLLPQLTEFLSDFSFIKMREYKADFYKPSNDTALYQDRKLGFSFEYPKTMSCKQSAYDCVLVKNNGNSPLAPYIIVQSADSIYNDFEKFEESIKRYASVICMADSPGGSLYCPKKDMEIEIFKNDNNISGYKVHRKMVYEKSNGTSKKIVETTNDTVIFYKLDAPHYFAVAFWTDGSDLSEEMLKIANSFRYLEIDK